MIADALVGAKPSEIQKLLSVGIETLLLLTADSDPDVRTSANEALNRVIRVRKFVLVACGRIILSPYSVNHILPIYIPVRD